MEQKDLNLVLTTNNNIEIEIHSIVKHNIKHVNNFC